VDRLTPIDPPVYRLGVRKALMFACAVPAIASFVAVLVHHKGLVDVEQFGLPESYLYIGGLSVFVVALVALLVVWRCPACGAYLGREANPATCRKCAARFS
jgi:hypothetical protein